MGSGRPDWIAVTTRASPGGAGGARRAGDNTITFSFFMFTASLRPEDPAYTQRLIRQMRELRSYGYDGFDLPIAPPTKPVRDEVASYVAFRRALEDAGLGDVTITTNVAVTRTFDPSSPYEQQRAAALGYLQSRVDISAALGASIMAGPIVFPYNVYPVTDAGLPIWSDELQAWCRARFEYARGVIDNLGAYAEDQGMAIGIEPVDHWEQATPNSVGDVADFLGGVRSSAIGVCIDSSHVVLGSEGPDAFVTHLTHLAEAGRINSIHVSAPDRGQLRDSWIPWDGFLSPVINHYHGPLLIEVFNALPEFVNTFRLTRPKFWIPDQDEPVDGVPDAYTVAAEGITTLRKQLALLSGEQ